MRKQRVDLTRPLRWQLRQHVLEIGIWIMSIEPRRLDQAHDRRPPFSAPTVRRLKSRQVKTYIAVYTYRLGFIHRERR